MIRSMVMATICGLMVASTRVSGLMVNNTASAFTRHKVSSRDMASGRKESELSGSTYLK